jgi:RNA polymerase sigma-70 factor (ECF subfamily)
MGHMDERTDEDLVIAVQEGDIFAFEILVKRYQKRLHAFVLHVVHDSQAAQDVVQESLVNLYKTIDRVDTQKKFSIYIFSITRNQAISYLRTLKKQVSLEDIVLMDEDEHLYHDIIVAEKRHVVKSALSKLEEKYRKVIRLYYFDDLSYQEIGKALNLPVNTVRIHLFRAKEALRKRLLPYHETS